MKDVVFWDVRPCGSRNNRRFGGTYRLQLHGNKNRQTTKTLAAHNNLSKLRRKDDILHSHRRVNLKSYKNRTSYEVLRQEVFSNLPSLYLFSVQIFSPTPCSQSPPPPIYIPPLEPDTTFLLLLLSEAHPSSFLYDLLFIPEIFSDYSS
jgi:hypothetical protein